MKHVGMSKPKKHADKVSRDSNNICRRLTQDPELIKQTLLYNPTFILRSVGTHVGLYGSGFLKFNFNDFSFNNHDYEVPLND